MLEIKALTKNYGKIKGAKNISFTLKKGEILGFIGPNGAGKSTTMNMIAGFLAPTSGDAEADGILMSENPVGFKKYIGYLPERPPLYNEFTVNEYLLTVMKMKKFEADDSYIKNLTDSFGLSEVRERVIGNLSKGYKQRIGLAQAFVGLPSYVILDEPTVGLDPIQKKSTLELIKHMKKNYGILLSSHILSEISYVCDRIIIINEGELAKQIDSVTGKKNIYAYKIVGNDKLIIKTLLSCNGVVSAEKNGHLYLVETNEHSLTEIFWKLSEAKLAIIGIEPYHVNVEDEFMRTTGSNKRRHKNNGSNY